VWLVGVVALVGCASILGVDESYVVGEEPVDSGDDARRDTGRERDTSADDGDLETAPMSIALNCPHDGGDTCALPQDECCLSANNTLTCSPLDGGNCNTDIPCEKPSDCGSGMSCCVQIGSGRSFAGTVCSDGQCPSADENGSYEPTCEPGAGQCGFNKTCTALVGLDPSVVNGLVSTCQGL
jgi:hypothetical protein